MAHEAESLSPALLSVPAAASPRRKRLVLLCAEDLRPIACALEAALRSRGWQVDVEFGADARPWVQRAPLVRPSLRVLCVPGTVDRALAQQLRDAFRPDPEADLHILGIDDSPGLVQEIERLAGMHAPPHRSPSATRRLPPLATLEAGVRERSWRLGTAALAAFAIALGGLAVLDGSTPSPAHASAGLAASLTSPARPRPADLDAESSRFHEPVLAAMGPVDLDALDEPRRHDDVEIVLLDDAEALEHALHQRPLEHALPPPEEPRPLEAATDAIAAPEDPRREDVLATPLAAEPTLALDEVVAPPLDEVVAPLATEALASARPLPTLPPGFLPVAGLPSSNAAMLQRRRPDGLLPVAGITAAPSVSTVDPFASLDADAAAPVVTVDPFGTTADASSTAP